MKSTWLVSVRAHARRARRGVCGLYNPPATPDKCLPSRTARRHERMPGCKLMLRLQNCCISGSAAAALALLWPGSAALTNPAVSRCSSRSSPTPPATEPAVAARVCIAYGYRGL